MDYELNWEEPFDPLYGDFIQIPEGLILWRGYETNNNPVLSRPSYYGSRETAKEYAKKPNRALGAFYATRPLRLLDIRFLHVILQKLIEENSHKEFTENESNCIEAIIISFGLCSLSHQIKLMNHAYGKETDKLPGFAEMQKTLNLKKLVEQPGVRVGETYVDGKTMTFLKELFKNKYDGFISPRIVSPFHTEKEGTLSPELIVFNPFESGIIQLRRYPTNVQRRYIAQFIAKKHQIVTIEYYPLKTSYYMIGGGKNEPVIPPIEEFNTRITNKDPEALKAVKLGEHMGKKWYLKNQIYTAEPPHPTIPGSIFYDPKLASFPPSKQLYQQHSQ